MEEIDLNLSKDEVGSVEKHTQTLWVYENDEMVYRSISYVPALYNIFDEILAKAAAIKLDELLAKAAANEQRNNSSMNTSDVDQKHSSMNSLEEDQNILKVAIDVDRNLISVSNNVSHFPEHVETLSSEQFIDYYSVTSERKTAYGKLVSEYKKEDDVVALMKKRVVDWAGVLGKSVNVELNGRCLTLKSFTDYANLYLQPASSSRSDPAYQLPRICEKLGDRWEICVSFSERQFKQVSFVNGVATIKGGTHVDYVTDQISKHLVAAANKNTDAVTEADTIKNYLWVFVNSLVDQPAFDSPAKETLITDPNSFGSECELSPDFLNKVETILGWENCKHHKKQSLTRIARLFDAVEAGGQNSDRCTLILAVGDVADSFAQLGISAVGRDHYGVFSLTKQLLNAVVDGNDEDIQHFKEILGLEDKKEYKSAESLRYGHLMIMTDKEHDGSYFTGVLINFIYTSWPSLLKIPSFLVMSKTPVVMKEGLGPWTEAESKEYFSDLDKHKREFEWEDEQDGAAIQFAFAKNSEGRKNWLRQFKPGTSLDGNEKRIRYRDFVNKELILFPMAKLRQEIPSMVDGLKPVQRKVLCCCFRLKENTLKDGFAVTLLCSDVLKHPGYDYELASLESSIIGLAQDFVGSNNINLLQPIGGSFGTRAQGGKKRDPVNLLYAKLSPITRYLFHKDDDTLLDYQSDKCGKNIEPTWYMPVIPTVLVNGCEGGGTGTELSSYVPKYNPREVVANIRCLLNDEPMEAMEPWYKGFGGSINYLCDNPPEEGGGVSYTCAGLVNDVNKTTLRVTELPVGVWTEEYWMEIDPKMKGYKKDVYPFIKEVIPFRIYGDFNIHIVLSSEEEMHKVVEEDPWKKLNLETTISTGNMYLFDSKGAIKKYDTPEEIIQEFFDLRLKFYDKRKESLCRKLLLLLHKLLLLPDEQNLTAEKAELLHQKISQMIVDFSFMMNKSNRDLWVRDLDALVRQLDRIAYPFKLIYYILVNNPCPQSSKELWIQDLNDLVRQLDESEENEFAEPASATAKADAEPAVVGKKRRRATNQTQESGNEFAKPASAKVGGKKKRRATKQTQAA